MSLRPPPLPLLLASWSSCGGGGVVSVPLELVWSEGMASFEAGASVLSEGMVSLELGDCSSVPLPSVRSVPLPSVPLLSVPLASPELFPSVPLLSWDCLPPLDPLPSWLSKKSSYASFNISQYANASMYVAEAVLSSSQAGLWTSPASLQQATPMLYSNMA